MSEPVERQGSCLCGGTKVVAKHPSNNLGACHCSMCRKWGGGPFMTVDCGTEVVVQPESNVTVFDSSEWADRGFCKRCGSHLFYRIKGTGQYMLPAGLLNLADDSAFDHQVFIDEKPGYYSFANNTENMTGAEVFAMFAPPS